jgi:hypothetical protein
MTKEILELLAWCETEMRYAGWINSGADNPQRQELYIAVEQALAQSVQPDHIVDANKLAQPVQEPVGYVYSEAGVKHGAIERDLPNGTPLYTAQPAQRPWVGLTDEEISALSKGHMTRNGFARNIEQALKEKNT